MIWVYIRPWEEINLKLIRRFVKNRIKSLPRVLRLFAQLHSATLPYV